MQRQAGEQGLVQKAVALVPQRARESATVEVSGWNELVPGQEEDAEKPLPLGQVANSLVDQEG